MWTRGVDAGPPYLLSFVPLAPLLSRLPDLSLQKTGKSVSQGRLRGIRSPR